MKRHRREPRAHPQLRMIPLPSFHKRVERARSRDVQGGAAGPRTRAGAKRTPEQPSRGRRDDPR
jgi:hypothetical protein